MTKPDSDFWSDGDLVVDALCPKCKRHTVVYNGNYWCTNHDGCGWVMGETPTGKVRKRDKAIIAEYLNQRFEAAEDKGNQDEMDRMRFYMESL